MYTPSLFAGLEGLLSHEPAAGRAPGAALDRTADPNPALTNVFATKDGSTNMTHQPQELAQRYLYALRSQLNSPRAGGVAAARAIGRAAMDADCDTLALARMHEHALLALAPDYDFATVGNGLHRRTGRFFTEALVPMEKAHQATRESLKQAAQRAETLRVHTAELTKINRLLTREIARRRIGEDELRRGNERYQRLLAQSELMQTKLRSLAHQILSAQEQERREISRELHDEVVQTLVGINVELAALGKAAAIGTRAFKLKIATTQQLVEKSVSAVHQFARDLRPAVLDDLGLIPALQALMKNVAARKKLRIRLTAFAGVEELESAKRIVLYRVAQEALTNVARHAKASLVNMSIRQVGPSIRMMIHDNGKSFRVSQVLSSKTNKRLGLLGMRERVEMVGGTLVIESTPGEGTTVQADIPFLALLPT